MGATTFMNVGTGKTPQEAFTALREEALHEYGHGGYTGSIAEKRSFVMIPLPKDVSSSDPNAVREFADTLIDNDDPRVVDKYGPAGCIALPNNRFMFFGWAAE